MKVIQNLCPFFKILDCQTFFEMAALSEDSVDLGPLLGSMTRDQLELLLV